MGELGAGRLLPNGLLPNAGPLIDSLDSERWLKAEERTAELIDCIQPNQPSEERRNAVADYVQRLIMKCFPCQVFTFGSVPLKTYLPDGDIDLTAFSNDPNLKDSWARDVCNLLETEEKNENAEFHVKEIQYIQAEVKIIKCLVENIVVDISFNQLGGLCTLCFLEEVDNLINQNHLFKRSIILIKAWCYYESRILGAHHGLISTYALETLVLYIFNVYNNSFTGPLEVLYRFLEFFSNFDWDNFCVSLWGPVPINSLPDVTAEPPRKDNRELLLNKVFLNGCSSAYAVFPGGQDNQGQPFLSKHFNVIDPLRVSNNLGRSVSKGNFFRIRSAFALGAKTLARFLDCPKENVVAEVNQFFTNSWDRHGNGIRPDAPVADSLVLEVDARTSDNVATSALANQGQRNFKAHLVNDIQRSPFARTRSSPELTDTYKYIPFQDPRNKPLEKEINRNERNNVEAENEKNEASLLKPVQPHRSIEDLHQEEQDLVNIMASSAFHGFNGPANLGFGHLPFPVSPSFLASLGYTQRNLGGMGPANMQFFDPQFSGMQLPHGFVPHYFPGVNMDSNDEDSVDPITESNDDNCNHDFWQESEIVLQNDDKPQSSSTGMNYIPPGGSGGLVRSQPKNNKDKRDRLRDNNHLDHSHSNSLSKTSSESSWDNVRMSTKEKLGKKTVNHTESSVDDEEQEWVPPSLVGVESESQVMAPIHVPRPHVSDTEPAQTSGSGSGSGFPMGPMIIGNDPRQRTMNGTLLTFYPTGPPVPFLTMLPFYNAPSENGSSDASASHFRVAENGDVGHVFHPEGVDHSDDFSLGGATPGETPDEHKSDILNSDFASHWQNLQFGRFCQSPLHHGPSMYPSPVMVPPVYLQGRVPWDGPGRPLPNMNLVMNYGPRLVPVAPFQAVHNRPPNVYQQYVEDFPRYRTGTGTYLPNHKVGVKDGSRRGNYNNYERSDNHGDREANSKSRGSGRNQTDKSITRLDRLSSKGSRSMNSHKHDSSFSTYQLQNGLSHPSSSSSQNGPATSLTYGMYPLPGVPSNGSNGPTVMMVYPYEQNAAFASHNEHVDFGAFGPSGFSEQPSSPRHQRYLLFSTIFLTTTLRVVINALKEVLYNSIIIIAVYNL
ncbi:uncharacterized protein [Rutidosis leptorrhynchoides]|uniref:uncharacterized protein n=1 Tax=Rutidosis leptorrhynchoides TaxID=125765 RepID=UPI003A99FB46